MEKNYFSTTILPIFLLFVGMITMYIGYHPDSIWSWFTDSQNYALSKPWLYVSVIIFLCADSLELVPQRTIGIKKVLNLQGEWVVFFPSAVPLTILLEYSEWNSYDNVIVEIICYGISLVVMLLIASIVSRVLRVIL